MANLSEEFRAQNPMFNTVYTTEGMFYGEIAVNFERIYNKNNVPVEDRMAIPVHYGHNTTPGKEMLLLENLVVKGYQNFDRKKPFSWEYASTAVSELAKFHAIGLAFMDENHVEFQKIVERFADLTQEESISFFVQAIVKGCENVDEEFKFRLQQYCNLDNIGEIMSKVTKEQRMLVFGDFRPSNLMHRRRNGKLEIIMIDYQTLRMGNPVADLMYLIFSGSDEEFRRLHYKNLLDHYFLKLTLALKQLNIDVEKVYPRKTYEKDVIEYQPFGLISSVAMLPIFLVDPEEVPEMIGMESFAVKPNQMTLDRLNGIVRDFIDWEIL